MSKKSKLYILFFAGNNRYAVSAMDVIAIVPMAVLQAVPSGPNYLAGNLDYHGDSIPVVDINMLLENKRISPKLSTRILLVNINTETGKQTIGLLAEKVTEAVRINDESYSQIELQTNNVARHEVELKNRNGFLQHIDVMEIIANSGKDLIFE